MADEKQNQRLTGPQFSLHKPGDYSQLWRRELVKANRQRQQPEAEQADELEEQAENEISSAALSLGQAAVAAQSISYAEPIIKTDRQAARARNILKAEKVSFQNLQDEKKLHKTITERAVILGQKLSEQAAKGANWPLFVLVFVAVLYDILDPIASYSTAWIAKIFIWAMTFFINSFLIHWASRYQGRTSIKARRLMYRAMFRIYIRMLGGMSAELIPFIDFLPMMTFTSLLTVRWLILERRKFRQQAENELQKAIKEDKQIANLVIEPPRRLAKAA
ncbi:MAG: hypothetical protein COT81_03640 [Candidatus Buchananbacteria bacterium CG10_big_fil_rev_8_21_14_0_10_42_9]|uniref:Uncharacterized protein n=1 Tax=Candidatus Buchananbacteria bacterium CG10_big_fil_rev_8_21_14_0_10_42_9 TaxID=1974526 RepID=A0A2H0W338_9BACT|nr:MAG: hypothetical protein COT81_03640 [Candidatus Buchananbacteria bacterium CG10_big_fil_rev_8_21_14_0_10_42_9]